MQIDIPTGIDFVIEVPFPNDLAPFKVVRKANGKSRIVDSAQTREAAEKIVARCWDEEPDWYALSNGLESGQPR